ncbi:uncharacterized protein LOC120414741 [Culex pipiens pallens]|uniref:uncharacterized protein LOC120414741 n=1 Tax=Culex pipiens pallens TaxID=42434 RepID=UPI001952BD79|nr:uncharacterized protein LOC120414741 [Culex pipiens pallens]
MHPPAAFGKRLPQTLASGLANAPVFVVAFANSPYDATPHPKPVYMPRTFRPPVQMVWQEGYWVAKDLARKVQSVVCEELTPDSLIVGDGIKRSARAYPEPEMPALFRAYRKCIVESPEHKLLFHLGHMAQSANHRQTAILNRTTFSMVNLAPMEGVTLNMGRWARLEKHVRRLLKRGCCITCYTGTLFCPMPGETEVRYTRLPGGVCVPNAFFKALEVRYPEGKVERQFFKMYNRPQINEGGLDSYRIPPREL